MPWYPLKGGCCIKMYLCIPILPLAGSIVAGLFGRFVGPTGASLITTSCLYLSLFFSCVCFYEVGLCGSPCYIYGLPWFESGTFVGSWGFQFDALTATMCIVVTFVSSCVHLFSIDYMSHDPHRPRFMCYLSFASLGPGRSRTPMLIWQWMPSSQCPGAFCLGCCHTMGDCFCMHICPMGQLRALDINNFHSSVYPNDPRT